MLLIAKLLYTIINILCVIAYYNCDANQVAIKV